MITRLATESDIEQILQLQAKNLYANLSEVKRTANGFVTTPFTIDQIKALIAQIGAFVVEDQNHLAGYVFAGSWHFFSQWPIFPYMVSRFPNLQYQGMKITAENTFQYGPVCIDQALRGTAAFPQLFDEMKAGLVDRFPIGVTFINKANPRSFAAHTKKLNLDVIDEFEFNGSFFHMLAFPTK
jgi:hypothetical protein